MSENHGPLTGVNVLDLSMIFPGPLAAMYLGDLGANVIKVENPRTGDLGRNMGSQLKASDANHETDSGIFYMCNRNKKSLTVNIKKKQGQDIIHDFLAETDILIESFGQGTLEKVSLDYDSLKKKYPQLIFCHISMFGSKGPYANKTGHDGNCLAYAGLLSQNRSSNGVPQIPGFQLADIGGGTYVALVSILAALFYKERHKLGQYLDVSLLDGALSFQTLPLGLIHGGEEQGKGQTILSGALPNYQVYKCKDGKFLIFAPLEKPFLKNFLALIEKEDWLDIIINDHEKGKSLLADLFQSKDRDEWHHLFEQKLCCVSPVNTLEEALQDPHLQDRKMIIKMSDAEVGDVTMIGSPFQFSLTPCTYRAFPPKKGEQTDLLLREKGYSEERLQEWKSKNIV